MAHAPYSATENTLENQRIGSLQIRVAILCTLVQICDGHDINSIGMAVPSLTHAWNLTGPAFSQAFVASSVGILVGALASGPIGDRFGRKPLLLLSVALIGVASLFSAFAGSLGMLSILRFFTGIGIGGAMPGTVAITGDYTPQRWRATIIMITFTGAPAGGFLGGQAVAALLPHFGWPVIFMIGGVVPLAMLPLLAIWLPESPRFLAARGDLSPRQTAMLRDLGITPGQGAAHPVDVAAGNPIALLFGRGYALQTVLLWIIFFCSLMNLFLFAYWTPQVLHLIGLSPADAVFASSLRDFGAVFAVLYLGLLIDRFGPQRMLALHYAAGAIFIAVIALIALPYAILLVTLFLCGLTIVGSQTGANAACGVLYPARMRTSGIGWALGIGRLGGIAAPALGGYLLSIGLPPTEIFLCACLFALIAAAATAMLVYCAPRRASLTVGEVAS
ncbi:MAG TPA: MFS transporter [Stellaceae bacterium]|jgi:AAHS family 4-hydroxybenzoate transporter-like MFS transporter|nr:MFS transporter [Stellaceae bacterium]